MQSLQAVRSAHTVSSPCPNLDLFSRLSTPPPDLSTESPEASSPCPPPRKPKSPPKVLDSEEQAGKFFQKRDNLQQPTDKGAAHTLHRRTFRSSSINPQYSMADISPECVDLGSEELYVGEGDEHEEDDYNTEVRSGTREANNTKQKPPLPSRYMAQKMNCAPTYNSVASGAGQNSDKNLALYNLLGVRLRTISGQGAWLPMHRGYHDALSKIGFSAVSLPSIVLDPNAKLCDVLAVTANYVAPGTALPAPPGSAANAPAKPMLKWSRNENLYNGWGKNSWIRKSTKCKMLALLDADGFDTTPLRQPGVTADRIAETVVQRQAEIRQRDVIPHYTDEEDEEYFDYGLDMEEVDANVEQLDGKQRGNTQVLTRSSPISLRQSSSPQQPGAQNSPTFTPAPRTRSLRKRTRVVADVGAESEDEIPTKKSKRRR